MRSTAAGSECGNDQGRVRSVLKFNDRLERLVAIVNRVLIIG
jgi:hypothetical protein